jgi:hypothetical protein
MDINDIEKNLNNFPATTESLLKVILQMTIHNQAVMEKIIDLQEELFLLSPENMDMDKQIFHEQINEDITNRIAELRADIATRLF